MRPRSHQSAPAQTLVHAIVHDISGDAGAGRAQKQRAPPTMDASLQLLHMLRSQALECFNIFGQPYRKFIYELSVVSKTDPPMLRMRRFERKRGNHRWSATFIFPENSASHPQRRTLAKGASVALQLAATRDSIGIDDLHFTQQASAHDSMAGMTREQCKECGCGCILVCLLYFTKPQPPADEQVPATIGRPTSFIILFPLCVLQMCGAQKFAIPRGGCIAASLKHRF